MKPKQLFPEIEAEGYITRRDQFALRDELQREKADQREKSKQEKEVEAAKKALKKAQREAKKAAKAKAEPKRRGRPPAKDKAGPKKVEVQQDGPGADLAEPSTTSSTAEPSVNLPKESGKKPENLEEIQSKNLGEKPSENLPETSSAPASSAAKRPARAPRSKAAAKATANPKAKAKAAKEPSAGSKDRPRPSKRGRAKSSSEPIADEPTAAPVKKSPRTARAIRRLAAGPAHGSDSASAAPAPAMGSDVETHPATPKQSRKRKSGSKDLKGEENKVEPAKKAKTLVIDHKQQPHVYDEAVLEMRKLFKHCCDHHTDCHRPDQSEQFAKEAPCRLSIYWKVNSCGLKVKQEGTKDSKEKWPQVFYITSPTAKCIQVAIYIAKQLASWLKV